MCLALRLNRWAAMPRASQVGNEEPSAQAWVDAITGAVAALAAGAGRPRRASAPPLKAASGAGGPGFSVASLLAGNDTIPPLPPPVAFLSPSESVVLCGPVTKQGPSKLSMFKPRLLVLTNRRLHYLSSNPTDKKGRIVLTPDSVAGVTHRGLRFELSAYVGLTTL